MKKEFYLLPLFIFLFSCVAAQDCSTLQMTYEANESRCVATGSILVNVTGGSGNYNYQVTGPVTTPLTSSNLITGLPTGYYTITVEDLTYGCSKDLDSAFVPGTYSDPRFLLTKTDASCAGNDGAIGLAGQLFGRAPFTYTIIAPSPAAVGTSNTSGNFTGLIAGEYAVRLQDSCGGIQVRRVTIENYTWWFDSVDVARVGCDSGHVYIRLADNKGNLNTSGTAFNGFLYGVVLSPGDTLWKTSKSFNFFLGNKRNAVIVVKDNCGNIQITTWYLPNNVKPSVGTVSLTNYTCTTFTATLGGKQNLTTPNFCLYDVNDVIITCNSTGIFTNLPFGNYCIQVTNQCYDTSFIRCFVAAKLVPSVDAAVLFSNATCSTFTAAITSQTNIVNPNYCLLNALDDTLSCNTTGVFNNIPYGSYCIDVKNGCIDTIIKRCFTYARPAPLLTTYTFSGITCSSFTVTASGSNLVTPRYCLYDSSGNVIACDSTGIFTGLNHGNYCIRAISCGDTTASLCFTNGKPIPSVGASVQISNKICTGFTAAISGQTNLTAPQYCLYNSVDTLITCNTTGIFTNLPYGSYCINVKDSCTDSTIRRCFSQLRAVPGVNATVQQTNSTCTTFDATVTGTNLTNPQYCITDSLGVVISCNSTGIFTNIPFGRYCFTVHDGCTDTTITRCQTFTTVKGITISTWKSCNIGKASVNIQFANGNGPYRIKIYRPNGTILNDTTTSANPFQILLAGLPAGAQYRIITTDACNQTDSALVTPDASIITKSIVARSKCPSAIWANGAGDLLVTCTSNFYATTPVIIKKDGSIFSRSFSSVTGNVYTFSDLEPASYIIEYNMVTCNSKLYDTVSIQPYAYPSQGQSAIYQCDNNTLSLGADVQGGVSPYTFQIIGSTPSSPSIVTAPQTSPIFSINTGTIYSLVRLRAIDACGNATLNDVSVLPLQNISITANQTCFYENTTLSVDSIPNATYEWYRKITASDSTLLGTGTSYNLPFFVPEEIGQYVCKVDVNGGCLIRLSYFTLDGQCGLVFLPVSLQLKGKENNSANILSWMASDEKSVLSYNIERSSNNNNYISIGTVTAYNRPANNSYIFTDQQPDAGRNFYRLKIIYRNGKEEYSNSISLLSKSNTKVYPNPVKDELHISITSSLAADFKIDLIDLSGRTIFSNEVRNTTSIIYTYKKQKTVQPGIYLLRVTNTTNRTGETYRILFE